MTDDSHPTENTAEELRQTMRRLSQLPATDLRFVYQTECERVRRFYTGAETEAMMLRALLLECSQHYVRL